MAFEEIIFEVVVTSIILASMVSFNNHQIRKRIEQTKGDDCKENMRYFLRHPYIAFFFNLGLFIVISLLIRYINHIFFGEASKILNKR